MAEREPAMLGDNPRPSTEELEELPTTIRTREEIPVARPVRGVREAPTVHVAGFWRRFAAAWIDLAIVLPVGLLLGWIVAAIADVSLPPSRIRGIDFWLDLFLESDPALMIALVTIALVGLTYLMVFQVLMGQTLGMRALKMRVIDVYGDRPTIARCAARTAGYLAGFATILLGFLWVGFDSEKRGLHDWIAGTYVIRA